MSNMEIYVQGKPIDNQFSYMGHNVKKYIFCYMYLGALGALTIIICPSCFQAILYISISIYLSHIARISKI